MKACPPCSRNGRRLPITRATAPCGGTSCRWRMARCSSSTTNTSNSRCSASSTPLRSGSCAVDPRARPMLVQVFTALALSLPPVQDAAAEATPVAELDALIARTNALKSFRAKYHFKKGDEVDVSFELVYQAPDRMRLEIQQGLAPELQDARTWVIGSRLIV